MWSRADPMAPVATMLFFLCLVLTSSISLVASTLDPFKLAEMDRVEADRYIRATRVGTRVGPQYYPDGVKPYIPDPADAPNRSEMMLWNKTGRPKFFACLTQKSGSTEWMELLRRIKLPNTLIDTINNSPSKMYHYKSLEKFGLLMRPSPTVKDIHPTTRKRHERITVRAINEQKYFKFAIVRHPWKRIVSGFRNKFLNACKADRHCFAKQYKLPGLLTSENARKNVNVTFHEFAQVLAAAFARGDHINPHFRPTSQLCEVGKIPYNYIGELDNPIEMDYLSVKIGAKVPFSQKEKVVEPFRKVVAFACSAETVRLLEQVYQGDIDAFGYSFDEARRNCTEFGATAKTWSVLA